MPNVRQWFVESTLYPFIGGDTVRREEMKVAGLQPSINMILPYATPKLSGCSREALVEFSACCIENSRDLLQVLEAEYRKQYAKNLTLSRLSEAVILPLCRIREAAWSTMRISRHRFIWKMIWRCCRG